MKDPVKKCQDLIETFWKLNAEPAHQILLEDPDALVFCDEVYEMLRVCCEENSPISEEQSFGLVRAAIRSPFRGSFIGSCVHHMLPVEEMKALGFTSILTEGRYGKSLKWQRRDSNNRGNTK